METTLLSDSNSIEIEPFPKTEIDSIEDRIEINCVNETSQDEILRLRTQLDNLKRNNVKIVLKPVEGNKNEDELLETMPIDGIKEEFLDIDENNSNSLTMLETPSVLTANFIGNTEFIPDAVIVKNEAEEADCTNLNENVLLETPTILGADLVAHEFPLSRYVKCGDIKYEITDFDGPDSSSSINTLNEILPAPIPVETVEEEFIIPDIINNPNKAVLTHHDDPVTNEIADLKKQVETLKQHIEYAKSERPKIEKLILEKEKRFKQKEKSLQQKLRSIQLRKNKMLELINKFLPKEQVNDCKITY